MTPGSRGRASTEWVAALVIALAVVACGAGPRTTARIAEQQQLLAAIESAPSNELLYATEVMVVFYDRLIERCVAIAEDAYIRLVGGEGGYGAAGIGLALDTWECDPELIKERFRRYRGPAPAPAE